MDDLFKIKYRNVIYSHPDNFIWRYLAEERDNQNQIIFVIQFSYLNSYSKIVHECKVSRHDTNQLEGIYKALKNFSEVGVCVFINSKFKIIARNIDTDFYEVVKEGYF